jgi:outer membrane receptor for ferric coprogen and ferric-rhodotorulic acid
VIKAEASLLEEMLVVYAGLGGGLERNSYESLSEENPYINSVLPLNYTNNKFEAYGGVKGRVKEVADYDLNITYRSIEDMHVFVNDTSTILGNTFNLVYDDANLFRFNGELGFRSRSDFGLLLGVTYNAYAMDKEEKAWHKPALELSLETYYIVKEKLTLKANITSRSGVYARTFDDNGTLQAKQLDGWFDIGLGGEYQINKQFSAFINFNNLLNNDYMRWYNYPVQKFNVLAGVGFSF